MESGNEHDAIRRTRLEEARLGLALESAHSGVWDWDVRTGQNFWSDELWKVYGLESGSVDPSYEAWAALVFPEDLPAAEANIQKALENKAPLEFEWRLVERDGCMRWVMSRGKPFLDDHGQLERYIGIVLDIDERVRVEEERRRTESSLRESEERYDIAFRTSPDSININAMDGVYIDCNEGFTRMTGYSREEIVGVPSSRIGIWVDPMDRERLIQGLLENGKVDNLEAVFRRKDGSLVDGLMSARIITIHDQPCILSVTRDITELRKVRDAYIETDHFNQALIEQASEAFFFHDSEGRFLGVNQQACDSLGYTKEELLRMSVADVEVDFDLLSAQREWTKIEPGMPFTLAGHQKRKDGTLFPVEVRFGCVIRNGKKVFLGLARDVTERVQKERRITQLNRLYAVLSRINEAIVHIQDQDELFEEACRIATGIGEYRMAWIGLVGDTDGRVRPVASSEDVAGYLDGVEILAFDGRLGAGPTGTAIREGRCVICSDIVTDPSMAPWRESALRMGYHSSASIPLRKRGRVFGAMTVYSLDRNGFDKDDENLLMEISDDISFALDSYENEKDRRAAQEALKDSEERYRTVADHTFDWEYWEGTDGRFVYSSPSCETITGYSRKEVSEEPDFLHAIMHPEDRAVLEDHEAAVRGDEMDDVLHADFRILRKDGEERWISHSCKRILGPDGTSRGRRASNRDITAQKTAECEVLQSHLRMRRTFTEAIHALAFAIETRDPYTTGHQERVSRLATAIATEMALPPDVVEGIQIAATLHDIGKLSVPAELLSKPVRLSALEHSLIETHSQSGYEILSRIEFPWPIAEIVYQHHERMDGSGYPRNLKGSEILLEARILCVADVVEAMSSHRPYRPALGEEKALEEIALHKGSRYDSEVAEACVRVFVANRFRFDPA